MAQKILIVDDDERLIDLYKATLESQGYVVKTAKDGEDALSRIMEEKPDLVLLDIMMPKIQGVDTLDIIKATPEVKDIKIIVLSALSDDKIRERALSLGADAYLVKSEVTISDTLLKISQILSED